ncbi:MAG: hypothetical protein ACRDRA_18080 [Pseudonocardiaceae bacterium]
MEVGTCPARGQLTTGSSASTGASVTRIPNTPVTSANTAIIHPVRRRFPTSGAARIGTAAA